MTTNDPPVDARELRDMFDERAIRRLHAHYVDAVNRSAWEESSSNCSSRMQS